MRLNEHQLASVPLHEEHVDISTKTRPGVEDINESQGNHNRDDHVGIQGALMPFWEPDTPRPANSFILRLD